MASTVLSVIVIFISFLATSSASKIQFCGRAQVAASFSFGSEFAMKGQWPWLVPLLTTTDKYFCGSTIVSEKHLLSGNVAVVTSWF
jgi:secreted trypsin-like serine protease